MFENPDMILMIARQRQKELLAELEMLRKLESSSNFFPVRKRNFASMMTAVADLLIKVGCGLKRKFGNAPGMREDIAYDPPES
jgi:hypothetical protein